MSSGWLQDASEHLKSIKKALIKYSKNAQKATREYLKSNQREREQSDFIIHHVRSFIR